MAGMLHDGELASDEALVARLLSARFPHLAGRPIQAVASTGTVHALYRIGDDLCARLPRLRAWGAGLEAEARWLPRLAPRLPLRVPEPVGLAGPTEAYPAPWAVYRWIDGEPYDDARVHDERRAAQDLAAFVAALRRVDPGGAPAAGRAPLRELDGATRAAIDAAGDAIDREAAVAAWARALDAPAWNGTATWIHADLLRPNLLVRGGRLRAVIDFGSAGVGDPAADVIAAWSVFGPAGRAAYRAALGVDDGSWARARGFALHQAALIVPYYATTNPAFAAMARRTVGEVVADGEG
jgi:aminoglycoside phosphotransferase (APT) family kinase protein